MTFKANVTLSPLALSCPNQRPCPVEQTLTTALLTVHTARNVQLSKTLTAAEEAVRSFQEIREEENLSTFFLKKNKSNQMETKHRNN